MSKGGRLPNGEHTNSDKVYVKAWREKIDFVENLTDGRLQCFGFDPTLSFYDTKSRSTTIQLPVWFVDILQEKVDSLEDEIFEALNSHINEDF